NMIVSLNDLVVIVVRVGQHRRSAVDRCDTPLKSSHVLRAVEVMKFVQFLSGFQFFLGFRGERGDPSVLGVGDYGITLICHNLFGVLLKGRIVVPHFIWFLDRLAIRGQGSISRTLLDSLGLLVCEKLPAGKGRRSFQRNRRIIRPESSQIRVPIRQPWYSPLGR